MTQTFSAATVETVDPVQSGTINLNGTKTSNIGTAAYIAPEVMSGRTYDAKVGLAANIKTRLMNRPIYTPLE
jgi:serine/threonine protein kinase